MTRNIKATLATVAMLAVAAALFQIMNWIEAEFGFMVVLIIPAALGTAFFWFGIRGAFR